MSGYGRVSVTNGDPDGDGPVVEFEAPRGLGEVTAIGPLDGSSVVVIHPDGSGEIVRPAGT